MIVFFWKKPGGFGARQGFCHQPRPDQPEIFFSDKALTALGAGVRDGDHKTGIALR